MTLRERTMQFLAALLNDLQDGISLRVARVVAEFQREIEAFEGDEDGVRTLEYAPRHAPGTVTIKLYGIPDPDGKLEGAVKEAVIAAVNAVLDEREDPEQKAAQDAAYEMAQRFRPAEKGDDLP